MIRINTGFELKSPIPLDSRSLFDTVLSMASFTESSLDEGHIAYCKETDKHYEFKSTNEVDTQLGKWREYNSSTGQVKLNENADSKYLEEFVDNSTIKIDTTNGVIKATNLEGLETSIATLNFIKDLDKDIMTYLNSVNESMVFKGVLTNDADLAAIKNGKIGHMYIVQSSTLNSNKTMTFIHNGVKFIPIAETNIENNEIRDFSIDPIVLNTETTGILPAKNIDSTIARISDVLDKDTYKGSADGIVIQADKLTGLSVTASNLNDTVANAHKHLNSAILDKFSISDNEELFFDGEKVGNHFSSSTIETTLEDADNDIFYDVENIIDDNHFILSAELLIQNKSEDSEASIVVLDSGIEVMSITLLPSEVQKYNVGSSKKIKILGTGNLYSKLDINFCKGEL